MAQDSRDALLRAVFVTAPRVLLGALMLAAIAINLANVAGRYVFGAALFWAEEILLFITIWGVFIGMAACAWEGRHLNMDLLTGFARGTWKTVLNGAIAAVIIACCAFMVIQSWQVVTLFARAGQVSVAAGVPKAIPHAALIAGFALTGLAVLLRWRAYLSGRF